VYWESDAYTEQIRRIDKEFRRYVEKHGDRYCAMGQSTYMK
jgi:hypothetical protein